MTKVEKLNVLLDSMTEQQYGVRWSEFDKNDRIVKKQKMFKTDDQRKKFVAKLMDNDNFKSIDSWYDE